MISWSMSKWAIEAIASVFVHGRRNSYATIRLGDYCYLGKGTPKNLKKALEMYENESGIVFAQELGGLDGIAESGLKTTL